ncbi:hypothetical protein EVAR_18894_1 [Eumeta japonica]|uniref:Uncharacterized protein n=1 Tax=Eumeta variegata TaxID=151549 RepID=A0A4C1V3B6_EUMVA|nr:hypothetical protein EVAR_18894_1 [Eumeta japonica]
MGCPIGRKAPTYVEKRDEKRVSRSERRVSDVVKQARIDSRAEQSAWHYLQLSLYFSDKKERLSTRTFLLYVEQHDLRFRLLRVADVGVSLPLQYVTLLVTYLIIMLQFGKLIDQHLYTT